MTLYAESSAVLRWLFDEGDAGVVLENLRQASKVVCSRLTLIECRRVVQRAAIEGRVAEADAAGVLAAFAQAAASWAVLELTREVADRAEVRFPLEPVRTLDAIHLASALALRQSLPDLVVLSTDDRMRRNCKRLGLDCLPA
ncbi:MAG TPA: type II toxin-antitoxin system VapC family toxin [Candidatus Binatia bacterium]|nr:type II toxin-antitoxin system VapC family toxin [Candidatus Binatia bacterium]